MMCFEQKQGAAGVSSGYGCQQTVELCCPPMARNMQINQQLLKTVQTSTDTSGGLLLVSFGSLDELLAL